LYRRAVEIKPAYAEAHNNLGVMLQAHGHLDEAIEHFREAVRLNPEYVLARENLGAALRARK
jgi:tetratricopeptide (TPR) repeat protein